MGGVRSARPPPPRLVGRTAEALCRSSRSAIMPGRPGAKGSRPWAWERGPDLARTGRAPAAPRRLAVRILCTLLLMAGLAGAATGAARETRRDDSVFQT